MPKIHQPDVSDPTEQRLRHLGDHLDAERAARSGHFNDTGAGLGSNTPDHPIQLTDHRGPAGGNELGVGEQRAVRYRWLGAAAVLLAIVAAAAILIDSRGGEAVQSAPITVSATGVTTASTQPTQSTEPTQSTGSIPTTAPATEAIQASTVPTESESSKAANATAGTTAPSDGGVANDDLESLPMCDAATGPVAQDCVYEVVEGDTPASIAEKFGIEVEALIAANADVVDTPLQVLLVGSRIIIPAPSGVANDDLESLPMCDAATGPVAQDCVYELVEGDSPMSIAEKFGIELETLFAANANVVDTPLEKMLVGTRIIIPAPNG